MSDRQREQQGSTRSFETRQTQRAFRHAMSRGLKAAYDPVVSRSVPDEFMDLLEKADKKRA